MTLGAIASLIWLTATEVMVSLFLYFSADDKDVTEVNREREHVHGTQLNTVKSNYKYIIIQSMRSLLRDQENCLSGGMVIWWDLYKIYVSS